MVLPMAAAAAIGLGACESKDRNAHDDVFEGGKADMNDKLDAYAAEPEEAAPAEPEGAESDGATPGAPKGRPGGEAPSGEEPTNR